MSTEPEVNFSESDNEDEPEEDQQVATREYANIHDAGFKDFVLKPDLLRAITDASFEHPSAVQHECIPRAIMGLDILCQAKAGMGKTAVFVIGTVQQLAGSAALAANKPLVLCIGHTHELAGQIYKEYNRFTKYYPDIRKAVFFGGQRKKDNIQLLQGDEAPHIVVGTPGRLLDLAEPHPRHGGPFLDLSHIKHFIVDECDQILSTSGGDMRDKVQALFFKTPKEKQVMMFSATLTEETTKTCSMFMQDPLVISLVGKENELILYGLKQYYTTLSENEKNGKLVEILDDVKFNQVIIFVDSTDRADKLNAMLREATFPSAALHGQVKGKNSNRRGSGRTEMFNDFKAYNTRILVTTDLCARGVDVEHVNVVINYDFPGDADTYMHRIGRAGRFGTKGMAISFVRTDAEQHKAKRAEKTEQEVFDEVQNRFKAKLADLPETIDPSDYK